MSSRVHKTSHLWADQARQQALALKAKRDRVRNDRRRKLRVAKSMGSRLAPAVAKIMGGLVPANMTVNELRAYARECQIPGRSKMGRDALIAALNKHLGL